VNTYTTRDLFVVTLDAWRDYAVPSLEVLGELCCRPEFRAWELDYAYKQLDIERALFKGKHDVRVIDMLHKAAYRTGPLANSIITPKFMVGKHKEKMMQKFASEHLLSGEACVVGINVDHSQLLDYANSCPITDGKSLPLPASPYRGGEVRNDKPGSPLVHVAIAGATEGLNNSSAGACAAVYCAALSSGPPVKYSSSSGQGAASTAIASALGESAPFGCMPLLALHAEQGLAGVYFVTEAANGGKALRAAVGAMRKFASAGVSAEQLQRAKSVALARTLMRIENEASIVDDVITQTMGGQHVVTSADTVRKLVDGVSQADVNALAKKIAGKLSLAAIGNLNNTPYLDELS